MIIYSHIHVLVHVGRGRLQKQALFGDETIPWNCDASLLRSLGEAISRVENVWLAKHSLSGTHLICMCFHYDIINITMLLNDVCILLNLRSISDNRGAQQVHLGSVGERRGTLSQ